MKRNFLGLLCLAVLCTVLALGLWPFHSPENTVSWLPNRNGLRFGDHGTVFSSRSLPAMYPQDSPEGSLEIWLQPHRIWDSGTFLAFYRSRNRFQFSLRQSQADLLVRTDTGDGYSGAKTADFYVDDVFLKGQPVFITVTSGKQEVCVYTDGVLVARQRGFPLSARKFTGGLVLADSIGQPDNWSGQLLGLAIYHVQLTAEQVFQNYAFWRQNSQPKLVDYEHPVALYLFDERVGRVVRDKASSGIELFIPEKYQVLHKIVLEPVWNEFQMSRSYWSAALKNVVGFIPFGFCFYTYLATVRPVRRLTLITVAVGATVSLTIEILQVFLPTRDSGTTDLITNTLGTWVGVASYRLLVPSLVRFFPFFPLSIAHK
jgi:VanZ family protein